MESANSRYTEARQGTAAPPLPAAQELTPAEVLATRGMVLWDRAEPEQQKAQAQTEAQEKAQAQEGAWQVAKRKAKRGAGAGHAKK